MSTNTPSSDNVTFGRGSVFVAPFVSGAYTGQLRHLGNCDTFSVGLAPEKVSLTDYTTETSAPYKEVVKKTDIPIKISGFEFASFNSRLMFMGTETSYTQTAGTITGETLAASTLTGLKGSYFRSANKQISAPTLIQGTATLVSGTDYEIQNAAGGMLRIKPTSPTVADGADLLLTYAHAALTGTGARTRVVGGVLTSLNCRIVFIPDNTTGPDTECVVWNASLTPDGDVPFIADDFMKWSLSGSVQSDAAGTYGGSPDNPYFYLETY